MMPGSRSLQYLWHNPLNGYPQVNSRLPSMVFCGVENFSLGISKFPFKCFTKEENYTCIWGFVLNKQELLVSTSSFTIWAYMATCVIEALVATYCA